MNINLQNGGLKIGNRNQNKNLADSEKIKKNDQTKNLKAP